MLKLYPENLYEDEISKYFDWSEVLFLPKWHRHGVEGDGLTDEILQNCINLAEKLELVRAVFEQPMVTHCWYRPPAYSVLVGGGEHDVHTQGYAWDGHIVGMSCPEAMVKLEPLLDQLEIRMEHGTTTWIHLDNAPLKLGHKRYFYP